MSDVADEPSSVVSSCWSAYGCLIGWWIVTALLVIHAVLPYLGSL